ncbi:DNA primase [Treponema bryantii]|uniref:DNA primase n=1 Tax=Treponema bryantii TaxID=163 RepID=A0A1H9AN55_9SPIR|nr:DNA primase [Treponema bryantii]SEP78206.1 DNA primase [Treponema bryantii]
MAGGYISNETIDAVLNTTDIITTVGEYTKLERRGGNDWWGCCPFHGEKTASFHVDGDKRFYHCFGCHKGGNVISFIMEMEKLSYADAIESLAKKSGIPVKYQNGYNPEQNRSKIDETEKFIELYERTASMFHYFLMETPQGQKALEYVTKRGLTKETIEKFKLGYAPADRKWLFKFLRGKNFSAEFLGKSGLFSQKYPEYSFFSDRLMFPIFNRRGQVVAFGGRVIPPADESQRKYLNSGDLPQFKKRETLFGFSFAKNAIREKKSIIFCEGNMDVIAYHQCGLDYAVATLGTALTEDHIKMISGFVAGGTVYLSFDSDGAGQEATWKAIKLCREHDLTVKIIRLKGGKDPAEIMLNFGAENLTAQVKNAILDSDYLIFRLGEKYPMDTPEGKAKAALEFFQYVDALQSDIQKESCLEQLCQAFNLKPEAVKRDFNNRSQARERAYIRQNNNQTEQGTQIKLDAELRGLIAVTADLNQYEVLRSKLTEQDFTNPAARRLYRVLEECFAENVFTIRDILNRCDDENLVQFITGSISSGVYQSEKVSVIVADTVNYIKRNKLDAQRNKLLQRIKEYTVVTQEDQNQLNALLAEKFELDKQVQSLGKK